MRLEVASPVGRVSEFDNRLLGGLVVLLIAGLLAFDWSWEWPKAWVLPIAAPITVWFKWLARDAVLWGVEVGVLIRSVAQVVEWPLSLLQAVLAKGAVVAGMRLPPLPWFAVLASTVLVAYRTAGFRLSALVAVTGAYLLAFGLWESAMLTMALVLIAVGAGVIIGVLLGIAAWKAPWVERILTPFYDLLQVLPIFSYLLPIIVFFGFGPLSGLIATVIFAMPPMARVTSLALASLPRSAFELAAITGCGKSQGLWMVLLPSARADLLIGLNQVVNLSFAVAVFAAIIGAGGLGNDLFAALKAMRLGPAMEAGIAITLLAITLDRIFRAIALKRSSHADAAAAVWSRHGYILLGFAILAAGYLLSLAAPSLSTFPESWTLGSGTGWNEAISSFNAMAGDAIGRFRDFLIIFVLRPVKDFLQAVPWTATVGSLVVAALLLDGPKLAAKVALLLGFIVVTGNWATAMTSLYLVVVGVSLAVLIGFPLGLAGALRPRLGAFNDVLVDTIQTLPPFVYLVPFMMVLGIGDVPALASIALYSAAPAIRYTQSGLLQVRRSILEAASMSGCSASQRLRLVQLPIALPHVMLGLNQTIIMAFGMLVVTALVGTRGLEAQTLIALGKVDTGTGLVAGLCLVTLTMVAERLSNAAGKRLAISGKSRNLRSA